MFHDSEYVILPSFQAKYHQEFEMCVIKVERPTLAYSLTLAVLVIGPVLGTITFTAYSVGRALKRPEEVFFLFPTYFLLYHYFPRPFNIHLSYFIQVLSARRHSKNDNRQ